MYLQTFFSTFQTHITIFITNRYAKNVHPVYGAGIQTHDLLYMSLLQLPLDQGSRPICLLAFYLTLLNTHGSTYFSSNILNLKGVVLIAE